MNQLIFELVLRHGSLTDVSDYVALKMLSKCFADVFAKTEDACVDKINNLHFGLKHVNYIRQHVFVRGNNETIAFDRLRVYGYGSLLCCIELLYDDGKNGTNLRCTNNYVGPAKLSIVINFSLSNHVNSLLDINHEASFLHCYKIFSMTVSTISYKKSVSGFTRKDLSRSWRKWFFEVSDIARMCIGIIKNNVRV